jgi:hypothetical protein
MSASRRGGRRVVVRVGSWCSCSGRGAGPDHQSSVRSWLRGLSAGAADGEVGAEVADVDQAGAVGVVEEVQAWCGRIAVE